MQLLTVNMIYYQKKLALENNKFHPISSYINGISGTIATPSDNKSRVKFGQSSHLRQVTG